MNLIEQLGGYEKAKAFLNAASYTIDELIMMQRSGLRPQHVEKALLEYRRANNIFEVGDKVVGLTSATDEIFEIETTSNKPNRKGEKTYAVTFVGKEGLLVGLQYRHATDAEIKAGKRLEVV